MSADTIIPDQYNPQNLNRYSYVINNPLKYIDPTGHAQCRTKEDCEDMGTTPMGTGLTAKHANHHRRHHQDDDPDPTNGLVIPTLPSAPVESTTTPTLPLSTPESTSSEQSPISQTSSSSSPNWAKTAATVALIAGGAILLVGGLLFFGLGAAMIGYAVADVVEVGVGAALASDAIAGAALGASFYMPLGVATANEGYQTIVKTVRP